MDLGTELKLLEERAMAQIVELETSSALQEFRVQILGKKGQLTAVLRGMGGLTAEERPRVGQLANDIRDRIEAALDTRGRLLSEAELEARLTEEKFDVTLPEIGRAHV